MNAELRYVSDDKRYGMTLPQTLLQRALVLCSQSEGQETGGILIGHYHNNLAMAQVQELTGPPADSRRGPVSFLRGTAGLSALLTEKWAQGLYYVGEWHFHPGGSPHPSRADSSQMQAIAGDPRCQCPAPLLVIFAGRPPQRWSLACYAFPIGHLRPVALVPTPPPVIRRSPMTQTLSQTLARAPNLAVRYEVNRPVPEDAVHAALAGASGGAALTLLRPLELINEGAPTDEALWRFCFSRNVGFKNELAEHLHRSGTDPAIHVFANAPLPLLFHLGMLLDRSRVLAYQSDRATGSWSVAYDSSVAAAAEDFFAISGLPSQRVRGNGVILLVLAVTHPGESAVEKLRKMMPDQDPLAEVILTPVTGPGHLALRDSAQAARAVAQLRDVLDQLHQRVPGASAIHVAFLCPASLALALGRAVNIKAQHRLTLYNYRGEYQEVFTIGSEPQAAVAVEELTTADHDRITVTGSQFKEIFDELKQWLATDPFLKRLGPDAGRFLVTKLIAPDPSVDGFENDYLDDKVRLSRRLLLDFGKRGQPLEELARLFFLHEAFHIGQGLGYRSGYIGRAQHVLEAIDYDADVVSIEGCLAWRSAMEEGRVRSAGEMATLTQILGEVISGLTFFTRLGNPGGVRMEERRLRRHLIWTLQHARAHAAEKSLPAAALHLDQRVVIEAAGVPVTYDHQGEERYTLVDWERLDKVTRLELAFYVAGRLYRVHEAGRCADLLRAIRDGDAQRARGFFLPLFETHRELVPRRQA